MLEHCPDQVDNVLLEWVILLECHRCGRLWSVYPALFGPGVVHTLHQVSTERSGGGSKGGSGGGGGGEVVVTDFF